MLLFCHPTGTSQAGQAALALEDAGMLAEFWTCVHCHPPNLLRRLMPDRVARRLVRRMFPPRVAARMHAIPLRELLRPIAPRKGILHLARSGRSAFSLDAVSRALDRCAANRLLEGAFSGVYAFEHGAHQLFRIARERGLARLYDLPLGYWRAARRILMEEAERSPEWAATLPASGDSLEKGERSDAELQLAELVFVASTFALQTLDLAPDFSGSVVVNAFGAPAPSLMLSEPPRRRPGGPLRVLFIGPLGQRAGLGYLLQACDDLGSAVELTLIGSRPSAACPPLEAALARHRWIASCAPEDMPREMGRHDVFVLPSLFEGFGTTLLDAMAIGLPVITTPHTAGPDLINDGVEGFIVPIRSPDHLAEKLEVLRNEPERRRAMGEAARERATEISWENYRQTLAVCASSVLAAH